MASCKAALHWGAALWLLSGCGYRWQPDFPDAARPTITVPFISGDEDGSLTYAIVRALSSSGLADVKRSGGTYRLQVSVLEASNETTGFRLDPQKVKGKIRKNLLACEGRRKTTLEAALYDRDTDRIVYGPYQIAGDIDYDYVDGDSYQELTFANSKNAQVVVLPFSLGQLESTEAAQEAAIRPLYDHLAQKIVDVISSEW